VTGTNLTRRSRCHVQGGPPHCSPISPIGAAERNDLLELLDDRIGTRSTLITSQLPVKAWHAYLNDPTLADAILDRVVHSSHKIELKATKSQRDTEAQHAS